jgi:phage-related minor tail protein
MINRPLGVTLVSIVAWLSGFFQTIGAILQILGGLLITWQAILGWVALVVGIITLAVGVGLWRGSATARTIATIVFVLTIAIGVISIFGDGTLWGAIVGSILPLIGLGMLYTSSANRYFGS